jgi:hypothetical protein
VGFALMKQGLPVYYSESQRNAYCSQCATPGYWMMTLAYPSQLKDDTYYLAFEDWEGANDSTWLENDGDFNDKVFRISGVSCQGGGEPCDTGKLGVCAAGLTECQPGGELACRQQTPEQPEECDNFDNDCNGQVDDGENLCDPGEVCFRGTCVPACNNTEFPCQGDLVCHDSLCISPACLNVECDIGKVCRAGECVGACDGVVCPLGQICDLAAGPAAEPSGSGGRLTASTASGAAQGLEEPGCGCRSVYAPRSRPFGLAALLLLLQGWRRPARGSRGRQRSRSFTRRCA